MVEELKSIASSPTDHDRLLVQRALAANHILRLEAQAFLLTHDILWHAVAHKSVDVIKKEAEKEVVVNGALLKRGSCERGGEGETILHVAILCKRGFRVIEYLLDTFPELINEPYRYKPRYKGETALHMAVVQCSGSDTWLVDLLLKKLANPTSHLVTGTDFTNGSLEYGQTVLHFAVSSGKVRCIKKLLNLKAIRETVSQVDETTGNNVLHMLAKNHGLDKASFKQLFDDFRHLDSDMLKVKNSAGLTPVEVGIASGNVNILEGIKETIWGFDESRYRVPLNKLDSLLCVADRVSMIQVGVSNNDIAIITHPVIDALLDWKWQIYAQYIYTTWLVWTFMLVGLIVTPTIAMQPSSFSQRRVYDFGNGTDFWRAVFEVVSFVGVIAMALPVFKETITKSKKWITKSNNARNRTTTEKRSLISHICHEAADFTFCTSLFLIPIVRVASRSESLGLQLENSLFGLAAIVGWIHLLRFAKVSSRVGPLVIVFSTIITRDLVEWLWLYIPITCGFSAALYLQMQSVPQLTSTSSSPVQDWDTYPGSTMWMLRFTFGQAVFDDLRKGVEPWLAIGLFMVYGFLVIILLINVLIGKLANTFERINEVSKREWKMQRAPLILEIDAHLASSAKKYYSSKLGFAVETSDIKYFQFSERKNASSGKSEIVSIVVGKTDGLEVVKTPPELAAKFKWSCVVEDLVARYNPKS
ncbi:UNVERIFIED_CONTAM: hypothetical protein HDU68_004427 [Siphonaria sp. JEL0065]|nr:hypothetical protein HDU68_004427 [Siphonaria sp. JEL0065]